VARCNARTWGTSFASSTVVAVRLARAWESSWVRRRVRVVKEKRGLVLVDKDSMKFDLMQLSNVALANGIHYWLLYRIQGLIRSPLILSSAGQVYSTEGVEEEIYPCSYRG
ncbi:hypothetical protein HYDPIDRAFT_117916, partial [Hydnomerulius pinastri MD-312]